MTEVDKLLADIAKHVCHLLGREDKKKNEANIYSTWIQE